MKSILKQVLTVVVLLSVPTVFAGEATRWEKAKAAVKAGASKTRGVVVNAAKAGYNKSAQKAAQLYAWTINPNDTKLKRAGKVGLVATAVAAVGAVAYFGYKKLASMYAAKKAATKLAAGKEAAEKAKAEQIAADAKLAQQLQAAPAAAPVKTAAQVQDEQAAATYAANVKHHRQ
jgi:hypothetical protein